jgi:hypothetical protein
MKRVVLAAIYCSVVLLTGFADAATPAQSPPKPHLEPGTYRQINTVTKQALPDGSQLVIIAGKAGRLGFSLNAVRQSDAAGGFAAGTLPPTLPATWNGAAEAGGCKLTFEAVPNVGVKVTQDPAAGDCGFGAGVSANGTYQLVPEPPLRR